jgi:hypothetical protein
LAIYPQNNIPRFSTKRLVFSLTTILKNGPFSATYKEEIPFFSTKKRPNLGRFYEFGKRHQVEAAMEG